VPGKGDRRRVEVEVTRAGVKIWREAMDLRGHTEDELATVLTRKELATLNRLLKKMTLRIERQE
jgi:DNA-binding MarR family transcriptional regulator